MPTGKVASQSAANPGPGHPGGVAAVYTCDLAMCKVEIPAGQPATRHPGARSGSPPAGGLGRIVRLSPSPGPGRPRRWDLVKSALPGQIGAGGSFLKRTYTSQVRSGSPPLVDFAKTALDPGPGHPLLPLAPGSGPGHPHLALAPGSGPGHPLHAGSRSLPAGPLSAPLLPSPSPSPPLPPLHGRVAAEAIFSGVGLFRISNGLSQPAVGL